MEWAAALDLRLANRRREGTCVRWNGSSIVDDVGFFRRGSSNQELEGTRRCGNSVRSHVHHDEDRRETLKDDEERSTRDRGPRWIIGTMDEELF